MEEHLFKMIKKPTRLRKQQKRKVAKTSATLAGQHLRTATAKGYSLPKKRIDVLFKGR